MNSKRRGLREESNTVLERETDKKEKLRETENGIAFGRGWGRNTENKNLTENIDYHPPSFSVQFEPLLVERNETMVHHILVYACGNASVLPMGIGECYGSDPAFSLCSHVIAGWAVGGLVSPETGAFCEKGVHAIRQQANWRPGGIEILKESLENQRRARGWIQASCLWPFSHHCHVFLSPQSYQFPNDVGISIGTPLDPQWIRLEVHYSNFQNLPGEYLKDFWEGRWWSQPSLLDMGDMWHTCWILLVTARSSFPEHCDPPPPSETISFYSRHTWYLRDSAVLHLTPSQIWHGGPGAGHLSFPDSLYPPGSWGFPVLWAMQDREVWRGKAEKHTFLEVSCSPSELWSNP